MDPLLQSVLISKTALEMARRIIKSLGIRHAIDIEYLCDKNVEEEFKKCIEMAATAFVKRLSNEVKLENKTILEKFASVTREYLKSSKVTNEISKLLDPGLEIFDKEIVINELKENIDKVFLTTIITYESLSLAWEEFQRAFSFSSRSTPHLRQFLMASYEAGSFRALTNISDVVEKFNNQVSLIEIEEDKLQHSIELYSKELAEYKNWSVNFLLKLN